MKYLGSGIENDGFGWVCSDGNVYHVQKCDTLWNRYVLVWYLVVILFEVQ